MGGKSALYQLLRELFVDAVQETASNGMAPNANQLKEGSVAVSSLTLLRHSLGSVLQNRLWADLFIALVLFAVSMWLLWSICVGCRQLGCAFLKLAFFGLFFGATVFWLFTIGQLSNNEFHESYVSYVTWMWENAMNGRVNQ